MSDTRDEVPDTSLSRGLLSDRVRNSLMDQIATGVLRAGTPLDEQQLAREFGASRTPVREALRQLAAGGLVEILPRRGVFVKRMSVDQAMATFELLAELSASCARLSALRMTLLERSRLYSMHLDAEPAVLAGDVAAFDKVSRVFHEMIHAGSRNEALVETLQTVSKRIAPYRRILLWDARHVIKAYEGHTRVIRAIELSDAEDAARMMRELMMYGVYAFGRYIDLHGADDLGPMVSREIASADDSPDQDSDPEDR